MKYSKYKNNAYITLITELSIEEFNPDTIMNSGQVFRMSKLHQNTWKVVSETKCVTFSYLGEGNWLFDSSLTDFKTRWVKYFDLNRNYKEFYKVEPTDEFLVESMKFSEGMRILKQDFYESLMYFIISQQNNIPKIKKSIEALSTKFGNHKVKKIYRNWDTNEILSNPVSLDYYTFPSPSKLANLSNFELCSDTFLGYRGKYLLNLTQSIVKLKIDLTTIERKYSKEQQMNTLLNIQGVGNKVANCVMLYGLHNLDSYPIDTWIQKVIDEEYTGMKFEEYMSYINTNYSGYQGFIQQCQFYYKRNNSIR